MTRYSGKGWHFQHVRHSNARKYGRAGGKYASNKKWIVTAQAFDINTGKARGKKRDEVIDTEKNKLFSGEDTAYGIKRRYEAFWNELNAPKEYGDHGEVVFVSKVKKQNEKHFSIQDYPIPKSVKKASGKSRGVRGYGTEDDEHKINQMIEDTVNYMEEGLTKEEIKERLDKKFGRTDPLNKPHTEWDALVEVSQEIVEESKKEEKEGD